MHQTVREFFRPKGPTTQSKFWINSNDGHMEISITCIQYLMLCATKIASIDQAAGGKAWTTEHFEAYAQYLSRRPFLNYALEYVERHLQRCGQAAGNTELLSQLHKELNEVPAAYVLGNWVPQAWGERVPGRKHQDYGKTFRAALRHTVAYMKIPVAYISNNSMPWARNLDHEQQEHGKNFRAVLLHAATRMKYTQVVEALLIAGAEVEARFGGKTLLMVTAVGGDLATAGVLLDRGALVASKDGNGQTVLHLAAANGHDHVARLLIDRGADKESRDGKGQTPLHLAAANGHDPAIRLLVDRGANKEAKDVFGWGLLHTAAWNDQEATIQMLVKTLNANKEERDNSGWTALHVAAMNGCDAASRCLIEHLDADREAKDDMGWTALHFVAALGLKETAQLLIKTFDVDRGARNKRENTAKDLARDL